MADQVSRMASGRLSASLMRLLMNFLVWYSGRPVVSGMNGTRLTCGYRWMADQVSQMASGGLSASLMRLLMNFLTCGPGRLVVSSMKRTRLMCGYLSNLLFPAFLAMCLGWVLAAARRDGLQEKGATMETSRYVAEPLMLKTRSIRACSRCPFALRVRAGTSCSMDFLVPLCECITSAWHLATAACLRSTPPPCRHP